MKPKNRNSLISTYPRLMDFIIPSDTSEGVLFFTSILFEITLQGGKNPFNKKAVTLLNKLSKLEKTLVNDLNELFSLSPDGDLEQRILPDLTDALSLARYHILKKQTELLDKQFESLDFAGNVAFPLPVDSITESSKFKKSADWVTATQIHILKNSNFIKNMNGQLWDNIYLAFLANNYDDFINKSISVILAENLLDPENINTNKEALRSKYNRYINNSSNQIEEILETLSKFPTTKYFSF